VQDKHIDFIVSSEEAEVVMKALIDTLAQLELERPSESRDAMMQHLGRFMQKFSLQVYGEHKE